MAVAVAQFALFFGVVLLIEGLALALVPHRMGPSVSPAGGASVAMVVGVAQCAVGLAIIAARLLHVRRFPAGAVLFGVGAMLWVGVLMRLLEDGPLPTILAAGVFVGGLIAPLTLWSGPRPSFAGASQVDLAELISGAVVAGQGLAVLVAADSLGDAVSRRHLLVLAASQGVLGGLLLLVARPLGWSRLLRWLGGLLAGAGAVQFAVLLAQNHLWEVALLEVALTLAALTSVVRPAPASMAGPTSLRNRAAVLLGLPAGWATFLVALLASSLMGTLAGPDDLSSLAAGREMLFVSVVVVFGLATGLTLLVSSQVGNELTTFGHALTTIASGSYDELLPTRRGDERDAVLAAFDAMRSRVRTQLAQLERHAGRMLHLHRATLQLTSGFEERALAERALSHALELLNADTGSIWLRAPASSELRLMAVRGDVSVARRFASEMAEQPGISRIGRSPRDGAPLVTAPLSFRGHESNGLITLVRSGRAAPAFLDDDLLVLGLFAGMLANAVHAGRLGLQLGRLEGQRETEQLKAEFLASISHELRTPLTMIHGYAELLRDRNFEASQVRRVGAEIFNASSALTRMVDDLLDDSRLAAGRFSLTHNVVDVNQIVNEAVGMLRQQLVEQAIIVEQSLYPPPLMADGDRVRQAVANLISNALKYGPDRGVVRVRTTAADARLRIAIQDQGPGVPPEERERVFERFYRAAAHTGSTVRGVGLGLAVVRAIAEGHGGEVGIETAPGGGSIFWFSLPLGEVPPGPPGSDGLTAVTDETVVSLAPSP